MGNSAEYYGGEMSVCVCVYVCRKNTTLIYALPVFHTSMAYLSCSFGDRRRDTASVK
jgi:hypothetical protein